MRFVKKGGHKGLSKQGETLLSDLNISSFGLIFLAHNITSQHRDKRVWILGSVASLLILLVILFLLLPQSWIIRSYMPQAKTYPYVSVLGTNVGNLNNNQLEKRLVEIKNKFENRKITLVNGQDQWSFDLSKLGAVFDSQATARSVWQLNELNFIDKLRLIVGSGPKIVPAISIDNNRCVESLSTISIVASSPKDAAFYFDQGVKITPDQLGTSFSAVSNCQKMSKSLDTEKSTINVFLDSVAASLTKTDLEPKVSQIETIVGKPLSLESSGYQLTVQPEQLLALMDVAKDGSSVQTSWSSGKLDELINNIADKVNTYGNSPAVGNCQYIISNGGDWLDKSSTKKILQGLGASSPRSYVLPIIHNEPIIGTRSAVPAGSKGNIYLTFDDGMTYGDQIMNYAACYGVKVTFFEIGSRVGEDAAQLRRAIAEGHAVQSHGYEHAMYDYGDRSYEWQFNDIQQSINAISSVTGVRPTYFRPPGGNRSANTYTAAANNGVSLILWGATSADTAGFGSDTICSNVLSGAYPGVSILMHSVKSTTAGAVPCIIEGLAARGYNMQALR